MILIATDKFKGTFSAFEAGSVIREGFARAGVTEAIRVIPMADGGEGTAECLGRLLGFDRVEVGVYNALGSRITASYYVSADGKRVAVDAASVLSLTLIPPDSRDIMAATSRPLGELLRMIITKLCPEEIYLGVGGTSTCDCGAGMMQALGMRFFNAADREITATVTPALIPAVARIDRTGMIAHPAIHPLCDVDVPLLAAPGEPSALTFAPQKGMTPAMEPEMRRILRHWIDLGATDGGPYTGAGGGLISALRATPLPGADTIIRLAGIGEMPISLIVTGEGCVDGQSLLGKVTGQLARLGRSRGIPVIVIAGKACREELPEDAFTAVYSSLDYPGSDPNTRLLSAAEAAGKEIVAGLRKKK